MNRGRGGAVLNQDGGAFVSGNDVACCSYIATYRCIGYVVLNADAFVTIAKGRATRLVGADVVALNDRAGTRGCISCVGGTIDLDSITGIPGNDVAGPC